MGDGLDHLAGEIRRDLKRINVPPESWTPDDGSTDYDVVVVGGGQMGLAASFALQRVGLTRHVVIDSAPRDMEGPWVTYARMKTLRSPNHLVGPAQDFPSLTFRAYYEARFGDDAWKGFGKIPNEMWQSYLGFFRDALALPVENGARLAAVEQDGADLRLTVERGGEPSIVRTRHLVLATGRDGLGGPNVPSWVPAGDPRFQHSTEDVDFAALSGKIVVVVGNSASAFDNAAEALESGAGEVHMLMRRQSLPVFNRFKSMVNPGFTQGFPDLADEERLAFLNAGFETGIAPPHESVARIAHYQNFFLHTGTTVQAVETRGVAVGLDLGATHLIADKVILGTGFRVDLSARPELAALAGNVRLWGDTDLPAETVGSFERHPYLTGDFALTPRAPNSDWVRRIHAFNIGAMASLGLLSGDIPGVGDGAIRLGRGIAAALFHADRQWHLDGIKAYSEHEIAGDELAAAEQRAAALALQRAS